MERDICHVVETVKRTGLLCVDINQSSKWCRNLYSEIWLHCNNNEFTSNVLSVEIPTEDYTVEEEGTLLTLVNFPHLKFCSLRGGKSSRNGIEQSGGLTVLPQNFRLPLSVTSLDLSFNSLNAIPSCLNNLVNLETLKLDFNNIEQISFSFFKENNLKELFLRNNRIIRICNDICKLSKLEVLILASNKLSRLPDVFHLFSMLSCVDVSNNKMEKLPESIFLSPCLKKLLAGHNMLKVLPNSCLCSKLDVIDIRYNCVVEVDDKIANDSRILLAGNTNYLQKNLNDYDVSECNLDSDVSELCINTSGAAYILPSGVKIVIPNNVSCSMDKIYCNVSKEPNKFKLNPTDQLLSHVVELTPNGLTFSKSLRISIPYRYTACDKQVREIVMRVTTICAKGLVKYEDLNSELIKTVEDSNIILGEVVSFVNHFSIFGVISRLKEDHVVVKNEQPIDVVSSVNGFTKLHFPQSCVVNPTNVTITVLAIDDADVKNSVMSDHSPVSNVLQVTVSPRSTLFQTPVTVYLALPNSLIGRSYDKDMLRLLKSLNESEDWRDITTEVDIVYTAENVSFQVDSFSKFWLVWKNVMGVARKVYQRSITYKVQFLAMQKQSLPSWVLAQCVRVDLVQKRINQLLEIGYCGKDVCSVVHDFMEGEWFKVKVIGDVQLKSNNENEKKHLEERVLVKQFLSQYPPDASGFCRFPIEPLDPASKTNVGFVSFYKVLETVCHAPESDWKSESGNVPVEKHLSEKYLDDVPITLDRFEAAVELPEAAEHKLEFGELGTGLFNESILSYFASEIGEEWEEIGRYLGLRQPVIDRIKLDYPHQAKQQIYKMLLHWSRMHKYDDKCVTEFVNALKEADRTDFAEKVEKIYEDGVEKFKTTIKRSRISCPDNF